MEIDWSLNKSWRKVHIYLTRKCGSSDSSAQIRLLFGNSPIVPYNESNLYNLYCKAYARAGFSSKIKVHMARRQLGYKQERMGYTLSSSHSYCPICSSLFFLNTE